MEEKKKKLTKCPWWMILKKHHAEKSMLKDWAHLSKHTIGFDFKVQQRVTDMNHLIYELEHRLLDTYESLMEIGHILLLQPFFMFKNENAYLQIHCKKHSFIFTQLSISILSHCNLCKIYVKTYILHRLQWDRIGIYFH